MEDVGATLTVTAYTWHVQSNSMHLLELSTQPYISGIVFGVINAVPFLLF